MIWFIAIMLWFGGIALNIIMGMATTYDSTSTNKKLFLMAMCICSMIAPIALCIALVEDFKSNSLSSYIVNDINCSMLNSKCNITLTNVQDTSDHKMFMVDLEKGTEKYIIGDTVHLTRIKTHTK